MHPHRHTHARAHVHTQLQKLVFDIRVKRHGFFRLEARVRQWNRRRWRLHLVIKGLLGKRKRISSSSSSKEARWRVLIVHNVDHGLVKPNLSLEELDVVNGLFQHGHRVHLASTGNQALQDLEPVTDPVPPFPSRHALWVRRKLHSFGWSLPTFLLLLAAVCRGRKARRTRVSSGKVVHYQKLRWTHYGRWVYGNVFIGREQCECGTLFLLIWYFWMDGWDVVMWVSQSLAQDTGVYRRGLAPAGLFSIRKGFRFALF